jgi:hypothetical protein
LENENVVKQTLGDKASGKSDVEVALLGAQYDQVSKDIEKVIKNGLTDGVARTKDLQDIGKKFTIGNETYNGE